MPKLTIQALAARGACPEALTTLRAVFGEEAEVSEETTLLVEDKIPWTQTAGLLLTSRFWEQYTGLVFKKYDRLPKARASFTRAARQAFVELYLRQEQESTISHG